MKVIDDGTPARVPGGVRLIRDRVGADAVMRLKSLDCRVEDKPDFKGHKDLHCLTSEMSCPKKTNKGRFGSDCFTEVKS